MAIKVIFLQSWSFTASPVPGHSVLLPFKSSLYLPLILELSNCPILILTFMIGKCFCLFLHCLRLPFPKETMYHLREKNYRTTNVYHTGISLRKFISLIALMGQITECSGSHHSVRPCKNRAG